MNHAEIAAKKFDKGYNCAQSVVSGFADELGDTVGPAFLAAHGFGGGMGRRQEVCGAVTGGIIVLGLLYGRGEGDCREKQDAAYAKVRRLMESFERRHGTVVCGKLLDGCVLTTPEGQALYGERNLKAKCLSFVKDAAQILDEVIAGEGGTMDKHG
ncbi:MAG: C_GCAxxG_C_C family protein [Spirochaetales bacterium]|nr:C_GCAxxG_C_C family protein [Spirochaetales bacterium]